MLVGLPEGPVKSAATISRGFLWRSSLIKQTPSVVEVTLDNASD